MSPALRGLSIKTGSRRYADPKHLETENGHGALLPEPTCRWNSQVFALWTYNDLHQKRAASLFAQAGRCHAENSDDGPSLYQYLLLITCSYSWANVLNFGRIKVIAQTSSLATSADQMSCWLHASFLYKGAKGWIPALKPVIARADIVLLKVLLG